MMRLRIVVAAAVLLGACSKDSKDSKAKVGTKAEAAEKTPGEPEAAAEDEPGASADDVIDIGDEPLANGKKSLAELGLAIVEALAAKNGRSLLTLTVAEMEYKARLFGVLVIDPAVSRTGPERAWEAHKSDSLQGMKAALTEHGGKPYTFVALESTKKEKRPGLVVHEAPVLEVKDGEGKPLELSIPASIIEHEESGTFVILSF